MAPGDIRFRDVRHVDDLVLITKIDFTSLFGVVAYVRSPNYHAPPPETTLYYNALIPGNEDWMGYSAMVNGQNPWIMDVGDELSMLHKNIKTNRNTRAFGKPELSCGINDQVSIDGASRRPESGSTGFSVIVPEKDGGVYCYGSGLTQALKMAIGMEREAIGMKLNHEAV